MLNFEEPNLRDNQCKWCSQLLLYTPRKPLTKLRTDAIYSLTQIKKDFKTPCMSCRSYIFIRVCRSVHCFFVVWFAITKYNSHSRRFYYLYLSPNKRCSEQFTCKSKLNQRSWEQLSTFVFYKISFSSLYNLRSGCSADIFYICDRTKVKIFTFLF